MSKNRRRKLESNIDSDGKRVCRWCKSTIRPPRRTFCSAACVHEHKLRSNNRYARKFVYERDLGICKNCDIDNRLLKIVLENIRKENGTDSKIFEESCKLFKITIKEFNKSIWDADHIKEVVDGGGECGLENYQTLCKKCHKEKTKERRKNRKDDIKIHGNF